MQLDPKQVNDNYFMIQRTDKEAQRNGQEQDNDKTCAVQTLLPTLPCGIPVYLPCYLRASINPSAAYCNIELSLLDRHPDLIRWYGIRKVDPFTQ